MSTPRTLRSMGNTSRPSATVRDTSLGLCEERLQPLVQQREAAEHEVV